MKKNLTMQLLPLWLLAFFFFASVPIKAQVKGYAGVTKLIGCGSGPNANKAEVSVTNVTGATMITVLMVVLVGKPLIKGGCHKELIPTKYRCAIVIIRVKCTR